MDLTVVTKPGAEGSPLDVDGLVSKHLEKKLEKIEQRVGRALTARAVLEELPVGFEVTVTLSGRTEFVGKAREDDLLRTVDAALEKLTRQVTSTVDKRHAKERNRRASGMVKQAKPF
jgi:ribosomal subunit interface protein